VDTVKEKGMNKWILAVVLVFGVAGCSKPTEQASPSVVQLSPVPLPMVKALSSPDLEAFKSAAVENVKTADAEQGRRHEAKVARWIYILAGLAGLVGLAALVAFFLPYPWLAPFKALLGESVAIAGGAAVVLFVAAAKVHALLTWAPWVALGLVVALVVRFGSKWRRVTGTFLPLISRAKSAATLTAAKTLAKLGA
jgi:hypothetical protein